MSFVISEGSDLQDFIRIVRPPSHLRRKAITVEYKCTKQRVVGVEVLTDINGIQAQRIFSQVWNCRGDAQSKPKKIRVKLKLPDYLEYNHKHFTTDAILASHTKLRAWILDEKLWHLYKKQKNGYPRALAKVSYDTYILPPFARPRVYLSVYCRKWSWDILKIISRLRIPKCPVEQETIEVIEYPVALNGLPYGVFRTFPTYNDTDLEAERLSLVTKPRFTVSLWLYILEYCSEPVDSGQFCSIMFHLNPQTEYRTPLLFLTPDGRFHVQVVHTTGQASAGVTHITAPRNQWFRLVFSFDEFSWKIQLNHGKDFNLTTDADFTHPGPVYMDDTEGLFVFGGTEATHSFKGYIGQATFFRGRVIDPTRIPRPSCYHPMFELQLTRRDEKCHSFLDWIDYKVEFFKENRHKATLKRSCSNSILSFLGYEDFVKSEQNVCDIRGGHRRNKVWTTANSIIRKLVRKGKSVTKTLVGYELYANATAMIDKGIHNVPTAFPLLKQAACCDNYDAMYTVAIILTNGIFKKVDEIQAHAYLMKAAMDKHRLSSLALGHKHRHGIDGVPVDREQSYAYHRYVADTTRDDKELHKHTDVFTESVRLTDEAAIKEQTDEEGDIFNWITHQAKQGVLTAQAQAGRILYWGAQGIKRNLEAAYEYYKMGAETEDPQAMYDYGVVLMRDSCCRIAATIKCLHEGHGTAPKHLYGPRYQEKFRRGSKTYTKICRKADTNLAATAASMYKDGRQNHFALNALGWYALNHEQDYTSAVEYLEKSFQAGNADAAYHLGTMHFYGQYPGMERDWDIAMEYFLIAGSRGQIDGGLAISHLAMLGTPRYPRHLDTAVEWVRFIAEQNPAIGYVLRKGLQAYRREDMDVSLFYYFLAAEAGLEVGSFNVAWLCEENKNGITSFIEKDCQWRHYNLSTRREMQHVDSYWLFTRSSVYEYPPYISFPSSKKNQLRTKAALSLVTTAALIKMGDYYWYGCSGEKDAIKAADYYAEAARKQDPQAYFNLGFMVEEGARIPRSILDKVPVPAQYQHNNVTMLEYLYTRCKDSHKSEAFLPCRIALWRVQMIEFWQRYQTWIEVSGMAGVAAVTAVSIYLIGYSHLRRPNNDLTDTI